jgi:Protein of unknown function (DUF3105)
MTTLRQVQAAALWLTAVALGGCGSGEPLACSQLPGEPVRVLESPHVPYIAAEHQSYTSTPPTSGAHVPFTVAPGAYRDTIPDALQVHALEHGHVLIQYAPRGGERARERMEDFARRYPRDVVVAPNATVRRGVALTAWGRIQRVGIADDERIRRFVEALAGRYEHGWQDGARPCGAIEAGGA